MDERTLTCCGSESCWPPDPFHATCGRAIKCPTFGKQRRLAFPSGNPVAFREKDEGVFPPVCGTFLTTGSNLLSAFAVSSMRLLDAPAPGGTPFSMLPPSCPSERYCETAGNQHERHRDP